MATLTCLIIVGSLISVGGDDFSQKHKRRGHQCTLIIVGVDIGQNAPFLLPSLRA